MNPASSDTPQRARPVLSDVANQLGKRGFALVSRSPASKSLDRSVSKRVDKDKGCDFAKQVSLGKENSMVGRNIGANVKATPNEVGLCPLRGGKAYRLQSHADVGSPKEESRISIPKTIPKTKKQHGALVVVQRCDVLPNVVELGDSSKENSYSSLSVGEAGGKSQDEKRIDISGAALADCANEAAVPQVAMNDERCTALKSDRCSSWSAGFDLLKGCSCSFCTKAAYIWSDLHYQDVKGRISVLMKSQKEANNLAQQCCGENEIGRQGQENSNKCSKLETDLMNQWKSLFLCMKEVLANESSQLETSYLGLKDMRENLKMNLDMRNGVPSEVQQCSFDPSADKII